MHDVEQWTRRRLLKVSGAAAGAGAASRFGLAGHAQAPLPATEMRGFFVYTAIHDAVAGKQGVQVYAVRGSRWEPVQFVASPSPTFLTVAPQGRTLYVTQGVGRYKGLATGSVEAWAIDPHRGTLTQLNRQGLALAAVFPTHAALSRDGATLAVAAADGSACVLLSVLPDGSLGEPTAVRKQMLLGREAGSQIVAPAAQLSFAPDGNLLMAAYREGHLSVFAFRSGPLELVRRVALPRGCVSASLQHGPGFVHICWQDDRKKTLARLSYKGELTTMRYADAATEELNAKIPEVLLQAARAPGPAHFGSAHKAFCINVAQGQGSCLLRREGLSVAGGIAPAAMAWVRV